MLHGDYYPLLLWAEISPSKSFSKCMTLGLNLQNTKVYNEVLLTWYKYLQNSVFGLKMFFFLQIIRFIFELYIFIKCIIEIEQVFKPDGSKLPISYRLIPQTRSYILF